MDNIKYITNGNLEKNLGNTLILWIRNIKRNKKNRTNRSVNSYQINQTSETQYTDTFSVEIKNSDSEII